MKLGLIQPMHVHGNKPGDSHVYMPSSLTVVATQAIMAGVENVSITDQNLHELNQESYGTVTGINVVGPPYVEPVREIRKNIDVILSKSHPLLLGGGISGLTEEQFLKLFGQSSINGNDVGAFAQSIGVEYQDIPPRENISLQPAYELISNEDMKKYLSTEFCLYLSQGCKYACSFCAAERTRGGKAVKEDYRKMEFVDTDLEYLIQRAQKLQVNSFEIYLSNLDLFQNPDLLHEFAKVVLSFKQKYPSFTIKLRGLSTETSFLHCHEKSPQVIQDLAEAGLWSISFGVDGGTPAVWKSLKKGHNNPDKSLKAIQVTREIYGITPEIFMLFGHDADTKESMQVSLDFLRGMIDEHNAKPRPYVAKSILPNNDGWSKPENVAFVETLMNNPKLFSLLEYSTLPTALTHPDKKVRQLVTDYFLQAIALPGNTSQVIYPADEPGLSTAIAEEYRQKNQGAYDR
jgi:hypothetical protein